MNTQFYNSVVHQFLFYFRTEDKYILKEPFKEKKDMEEKKTSFRGVLAEFMGYTSGHGFGRLVAATSLVWRIFWILAVFGAFGMFVLEVTNLFEMYLSRPVQTSVSVTFEKVRVWCYGSKVKK